MRWIVATSLRFRYLVAGLAVALLYFGVTLAGSQKLDAFPEFAPVSVEIQTNCLGLSPSQIESLTTVPLEAALHGVPELTDVNSDQEVRGLQTTLVFDRETAARLGLGPKQIDSALNLAFGQAVVSTIYQELNQYRVVMEVAPQYWQSPEGLSGVWIISPVKGLVPLSAIAR
jgi:Cu/Ag efflux pump CusA